MTTIKEIKYQMMYAEVGKENPNPDFKNVEYIHAGHTASENVSAEEKKYLGQGMISSILPYKILDNYNRERKFTEVKAIALENDYIKAIFLPTLGGRLWSLYDKKLERELLYVNSVFQPANLAIRNAWFSGGVEWNFCIKGHNTLTCDSLFAEICKTKDGKQVLRMYEYERIRDVVVSIEAYLPDDEPVLYMRNTIENTSNDKKFSYWWSNIAVPETDYTRVIAPATDAFLCDYIDGDYTLDKTEYPFNNGIDYSYPRNTKACQDYFYKIPNDRAKWVAAVEKDGKGLVQFSQSRLFGRKKFLWGQGAGGKHWSEFLSNPGEKYLEIQAGLAYTQLEHIPMKPGETLQWVEGYCAADCNPEEVYSENWNEAQNAIEKLISNYSDINNMDECLENKFPKDFKETKCIHNGSVWGYIESLSRKKLGKPELSERVSFYKENITDSEQEWIDILNGGQFKNHNVLEEPQSYMVKSDWTDILEKAAEDSDNWYAYLQLGVLYYANGRVEDSYDALEKSICIKENPWAYRNLAMIEKNDNKNYEKAVELILKAVNLGCYERGIIVNVAQTFETAHKYKEWLDLLNSMPQNLKEDGRLLYYKALSLLKIGRAEEARQILLDDYELCDIKEGEVSISHLWNDINSALNENKPIPYRLDFRMHIDK